MANVPVSDNTDLTTVIKPSSGQLVARYIMNILMIVIFILLCVYVIWWIVVLWPEDGKNCTKFVLPLLCWKIRMFLSVEQQYLVIVTLGGVLGAFVHISTSFVDFLGSKKLSYSWIPWYLMRPFIGGALALIFYLLLRGGLINGVSHPDNDNNSKPKADSVEAVVNSNDNSGTLVNAEVTDTVIESENYVEADESDSGNRGRTVPLNPFGIMALACMAGMFSKQATDKLREVFDSLFRMKPGNETERTDKLNDDNNQHSIIPGDNLPTAPKNDDAAAG